jgi:hypothetical protein
MDNFRKQRLILSTAHCWALADFSTSRSHTRSVVPTRVWDLASNNKGYQKQKIVFLWIRAPAGTKG